MNGPKRVRVAVSVATVWTSPDSPCPLDEPALRHPAAITEWLGAMTVKDKLDLYGANRIQTQMLYGTEAVAAEESGDWVKVLIPEQSTRKEGAGYPGWVPKRQLTEASAQSSVDQWAEVSAPRAILSLRSLQAEIELSFLTRLPVIEETTDGVVVDTPHGAGFLPKDQVRIAGRPASSVMEEEHTGKRLVRQGMRFIGLPYLWGGMSSFGYDCSGFAYSMHKSQGILIPRDASDQADRGQMVERDRLEPGDLLFFAYEEGKGRVHHVGIYAGDNRMLHSPDSEGCIELVELDGYKLAKEHCISRRYW
ncbi:gamma-D-glutamyl-L-lysine endopeptidase [Paenibacillus tyrfis]|uniref:C40 family peptidase n=1 Tax=Paenibacillus tyrfis TaxID=1501230 RepID=UPI002492D242|nr:C40 family peptidase [Paenibacillus tyrfis]GLI06251.1 gamma-D-glutamyl-L-lysine endopeptidase [Paenibacillus tyrfis]